MNRLATEASPYLRQHRDNPVDWYPWGDEAFALARTEDRPVLLSIGYAACHWCHVMAHESFEDPATAAVMNEHFVNVKVDREERPDVDAIYMEAVQALTGRGGWPMTVFLTPTAEPFFAGTYFPERARGGMPAFTDVCRAVAQAWRLKREGVLEQARQLTASIGRSQELAPGDDLPEPDALARARDGLSARFDARNGGFGPAPKFPQTDQLEALLVHHHQSTDPALGAGVDTHSLTMVTTTLDAMAAGGIYDHLGGGFSRYSTDEKWLVPHFEKMLYDQALLARVYLHAWQVTGEEGYLQVASETIDYTRRDLRHGAGGFFSSEDADSEGVEGKFYVWSQAEIAAALAPIQGPAEIEAAQAWWGVTKHGNFEGASILHRPQRGSMARTPTMEAARASLLAIRAQRTRPALDDKVLAEWNFLFLSTLAEAASATGRADWLRDAVACSDFLLSELRRPDGRWLRSWQDGRAGRHLAIAADYAAGVDAMVRMAEATGEARWVNAARECADAMIELFWDDESGGLFTTGHDAEALISRSKDIVDGAVPSANSNAAVALIRLAAITGSVSYSEHAESILRLLAGPANQHPTAFTRLLVAATAARQGLTEIVITGDRPDLVSAVARRYLPLAVMAWGDPSSSPLFEGREVKPDESGTPGRGLAYVCRQQTCLRPIDSVNGLMNELAGLPD